MRALGASRTSVATGGILGANWARDPLWKNARAVPSLDLRFAENKSLTDAKTGASLVTFTRASTGTFVGSDGLVKTAVTNEARFDHNPTTGESLGLLVEEARTNLVLYSEQFNDATWTKTLVSVSTDAAVAPDGSTTADKLIVNNGSSPTSARISQTITKAATATTYTFTVFAKTGDVTTGNSLQIVATDSVITSNNATSNFSTATGTVTVAAVANGTFTNASSSISPLANGWYRCTLTFTTGTEVSIQTRLFSRTPTTGDGTRGILLWGAQLEAGAFATSYIPTTTATVTRAADVASITGTAFSSWYNQTEGTVFADASTQQSAAGHVLAGVSTGSFASSAYLVKENTNFLGAAPNAAPSNLSIQLSTVSSNVGLRAVLAFTAGTGSASAVMNGGTVGTDASTGIPITMSQMAIGCAPWSIGATLWNGTIKRLTYWPVRLANPTIQAITTP